MDLLQPIQELIQPVYDYWKFDVPGDIQLLIWSLVLFGTIAGVGQVAVVFMVLMERKVLAWLTQRKGPNRVGPWGVLQTVADGVKLLFKEDIMTTGQDKLLFTLGPALFFLPVFVLYAFVPFTNVVYGFFGAVPNVPELTGISKETLAYVGLPVGLVMFFALSSISVIGIVLSGWASNNKYSLLGGMRSAAQAISYEIPLVLSIVSVVIMTGSMDVLQIIERQNGGLGSLAEIHPLLANAGLFNWFWFVVTPVSFMIFFISAIAEVNRIPFDLPEAESELVSGYNTEYTGMKFAMFFLAEYAALFIMCAMIVALFFGGYYSPVGGILIRDLGVAASLEETLGLSGFAQMLIQMEMISWMLIKTYIFIFIAMWIRGTLPRLKPDQLMGYSWKFLIPLALINIFVVAMEKLALLQGDLVYWILWVAVLIAGFVGFSRMTSTNFSNQLKVRLQ